MKTLFAIIAVSWIAVIPARSQEPLRSRDLSRKFAAAHQAQDWKTAIAIGEQWAGLKPSDRTAAYNLACAYARSGDVPNACKWLRKSVDNGWSDLQHILSDTDLDNIRENADYLDILETVKERERDAFKRFAELVDKHVPIVVLPKNHDPAKPAPLIIAMHGYGTTADDIASPWRDVARDAGAILAAPRATRAVVSGGMQWGSIDEADYVVNKALEYVQREHKIDTSRIVLTGFSQGGYMTFNLVARHPDRFAGAIPIAGSYRPDRAELSALSPEDAPRFYLMVGSEDRTLEQNRTAAEKLKALSIKVQLVEFPGVGHTLPKNYVEELKKALDFVLAK